jgi:hypothetical protein
MSDRIDAALRQFYGRTDITDRDRAIFPVYTEIHDRANDLAGMPPLDQMGGAGAMEIAKVLTRFDGLIEDEWRDSLIAVAAGLLKQMQQHGKD